MKFIILAICMAIALAADSQNLKIKSYSLGYRVFEMEAVGNNPSTIAPFLKDPWTYQDYINNHIQYNGLLGNPSIQSVRNYHLISELRKDSTDSRFWKKYTVLTGLFLSNRITKGNMALENQRFVLSPSDTTLYRDLYSLRQKQQFLGIISGIHRRIRISNTLSFLTGLRLQGSIAFFHQYNQQWDSGVYHKQVWTTKTSQLPNLKGKNYFQWQAVVPLAFELNAYKHEIFFRAEADLGIVGDRFRTSLREKESD